ncbi:hypothetical protein ABPG75_011126 [Micractinium tetrahymenae]
MRVGHFELALASGGRRLPEVVHNGESVVVAAAGASFHVELTLLETAHKLPHGQFYKAYAEIDRRNVGYSKRIYRPHTTAWTGFLESADSQGMLVREFVFSVPFETAAKQAHNLNFVEGKVRVEVRLAEETDERRTGSRHGDTGTNESIAQLPEGKKVVPPRRPRAASWLQGAASPEHFFMAPSLTTGKGKLKADKPFSTHKSRTIGGPVAVLELRYETAATLLLRGVLKESDPAHRAILQQFPDTAAEEDAVKREDETGPSQAAAARSKLKRRQEQQQHQQPARQRRQRRRQGVEEEAVIDLTKAPGEGDEVLAAKQENKQLQCDLTAEDEPQWRAVKQQVHSVA